MVFLNNEKNGVLPSQYIKELINRNFIFSNEKLAELIYLVYAAL